ncbi:splicing regulator RBM11 isoform X1 [Pyxicephalus adspersus]
MPYESSYSSPPVDGGYFSQTYVCFQGMMNKFINMQNSACGWTAPDQQGYEQFYPWNDQTSMQPYPVPQAGCSFGPSTSSWDSEMTQDCQVNQDEAGSQNHKRAMDSDNDGSEASLREQRSRKRRKHKSKKNKNLVYLSK